MRIRFLIPIVLLCLPSVVRAETELAFRQASIAFDRTMIPALFVTNSGDVDAAGPALVRVSEAWESYKTGQAPTLAKASGWSLVRDGIDRRLTMADRFVESRDVRMVHLLLEQVRADLIRIREALDSTTFVDQLVIFHDRMEAALDEGSPSLADLDQLALRVKVENLTTYWQEVEEFEFDPEVFGFLWNDTRDLEKSLRDQGKAIEALREAVERGDTENMDQLAREVKQGFVEVYLTFGE